MRNWPPRRTALTPVNQERARLGRLLEHRRRDLLAKAVAADGHVDAADFKDVARLEKLYATFRPPGNLIAVEVLIGGVVALCFLSLLLVRVPRTGIELHADATKVRFVVAMPTAIAGALPVTWIAVQGHKQIAVSPIGESAVTLAEPIVTLQTADGTAPPMSLMIPELPADAAVELSHWPDGTREIAVCDVGRPVTLLMPSVVRITDDSTTATYLSAQGRALIFPDAVGERGALQSASARCQVSAMLRLRFAPAKRGAFAFNRDITVRDMELFEEPQPNGQLISSLVSGHFRVSSTKAGPTTLLPNDLLEMGSSSGRMRSLTMGDAATTLDFEGTVKALSIGSSAMRRSAMPSLLEWWLSQELIFVAWSAGLSSLAFLLGVYKWLRNRG